MLRIDGAYLYTLGAQMRAFSDLSEKDFTPVDLFFTLSTAKEALETAVYNSVFRDTWRAVYGPAADLLAELNRHFPDGNDTEKWGVIIPSWEIGALKVKFRKFEDVMTAELQTSALYYASSKGGFNTISLTDYGENLFPNELLTKVPMAIPEVKAAARCIAFELPTAAGFHLHRANEAVLRTYFDYVAGKDKRPKTRNMGDYIKKMRDLNVGDDRVLHVLTSLKDLHRNPLMHPDQSIQNIDEVLSLYAAIRAAIGYMLDLIPMPLPGELANLDPSMGTLIVTQLDDRNSESE